MAGFELELNGAAVQEILTSAGMMRLLLDDAKPVLARARDIAPVKTGAYRDSLRVVQHPGHGRAGVRVEATVAYGRQVEALHGVLAKALDAAGGAG